MQKISNIPIKERLTAVEASKARLALAPAPQRHLLNRELSLIEFFRHVLDEANDERNPLLERLRFLTIFTNIVDEFFMVRVSGLKEEVEHDWCEPSLDGMTAAEQLKEIRNRLQPMTIEQTRCLNEQILPELADHGIVVAPYDKLTKDERDVADWCRLLTRASQLVVMAVVVDCFTRPERAQDLQCLTQPIDTNARFHSFGVEMPAAPVPTGAFGTSANTRLPMSSFCPTCEYAAPPKPYQPLAVR